MSDTDLTPEEWLAHFGVKGMKWGVRRQQRLDRLNRVAEGKGSFRDKAKVLLTETSQASLARNHGLKGAARARAQGLDARKKRIEAGQAKVSDLLALHGGDKIFIVAKAK